MNDQNIGVAGEQIVRDKQMGARINDPCVYDELSFDRTLTQIINPPYYLSSTPESIALQWIVGQTYHTCPFQCGLALSGTTSYPPFVVDPSI